MWYFQDYKYLKYAETILKTLFYQPKDIDNLNEYQLYQEILNTFSFITYKRW